MTMNDAEYESQKARVLLILGRWVGPLGLGWWRNEVEWFRDRAIPEHEQAAMTCTPDYRYGRFVIQVDLVRVADLNDTELEFAVVHELAHVFLSEMLLVMDTHDPTPCQAWEVAWEHTTTTIANAFLWLRKHCEAEAQHAP